MANHSYTNIIIEATPGRLDEFDKKLSSIEVFSPAASHTVIDSKKLAELLGWNPDEITQIADIIFHQVRGNTLFLNVRARSCKPVFLLEMLNKEFPHCVFYQSDEWLTQYHVTNDKSGKYFPERVVVNLRDKQGCFRSEKEAAEFIERETGIFTAPTFDAIWNSLVSYWSGVEREMCYRYSVEED